MSPLVDRGLVIVHVGGHNNGALTAFDARTGDVKWSWTGDGPAYGSPIVVELGGTRQVITITQENLVGVVGRRRRAAVEAAVFGPRHAQRRHADRPQPDVIVSGPRHAGHRRSA